VARIRKESSHAASTMKTLTEQFKKILGDCKVEAPFPEGAHLLADLLQAVKERDSYVIGEDEEWLSDTLNNVAANNSAERRNQIRAKQRKRAEETL
jgi:hypothetical protein